MASVNYGPGEALLDQFVLLDECIVTRDQQSQYDDAVDPVTFKLVKPEGDTSTVYSGKCAVKRTDTLERGEDLGGVETRMTRWKGMFPVTATNLRPGDILVVTSAHRDQWLVGRRFVLGQAGGGSHRVYRDAQLELLDPPREEEIWGG